jgi:hypothetical protein
LRGSKTHLITEGVQEFDGVHDQNGMDGPGPSLQVGKDILTEKVDNVD